MREGKTKRWLIHLEGQDCIIRLLCLFFVVSYCLTYSFLSITPSIILGRPPRPSHRGPQPGRHGDGRPCSLPSCTLYLSFFPLSLPLRPSLSSFLSFPPLSLSFFLFPPLPLSFQLTHYFFSNDSSAYNIFPFVHAFPLSSRLAIPLFPTSSLIAA